MKTDDEDEMGAEEGAPEQAEPPPSREEFEALAAEVRRLAARVENGKG